MADEQGVATAPEQAIDAEIRRIVRLSEGRDQVSTYRNDALRVYAYKILRVAYPDKINRETWRAMADVDPDVSQDPTERARLQREAQQRAEQAQAQAQTDRAFLRQHNRPVCCAACDRENAEALRRGLGLPEPTQAPAHLADDGDEGEDEDCGHEDVQCRECGGTGCGGWDRWGDPVDCSNSCPSCEECEYEHPCSDCGLDPSCTHAWRCEGCDQDVRWERDHWEND
jgi:hypothetical protein